MADAKPVTTFRFDEATRAELDTIQEHLGKNTWQQTINAIIMDYMRLVVRLRMANQANDLLERKLVDNDRRLRTFRAAFRDIMEIEEPEQEKKADRTQYPTGSLISVLDDEDIDPDDPQFY